MNAHKISVKFYVEDDSRVAQHEFVPVFHSWIQNHSVPEHMLVDVADYAHVHNGPGTLLVAHEANFYADRLDGRLGLTYSRKHAAPGSFLDGLRQAVTAALEACVRLEDDARLAGKVKFGTGEMTIRIPDRLLAPNTPQTYQEVRGDIETLAADLYGAGNFDVEHILSEKLPFEVRIIASSSLPDVSSLLNRLGFATA
ncbi:MAG: hypothetical protein QOF78_1743 [Phycisphaerales bacterium]|jgi:hypothetical protein|nr:hypothetical protein [Phycisphaerales bacterium]